METMHSILKNKLTFKQSKRVLAAAAFLFLLFGHTLWSEAMSEDEYAGMAAESMILLHQAGGDSRAIQKASEDFLNKFPQEKVEEYIMMARQMMQDEALARRVSEKVISILNVRGYQFDSTSGVTPGSVNTAP